MPVDLDHLARAFGSVTVTLRGGATITARTLSAAQEVAIIRQVPEPPVLGRNPQEQDIYRQGVGHRAAIHEHAARRMALRAGIAGDIKGPPGLEEWSPRWEAGERPTKYAEHVMAILSDRELMELHLAGKGIRPQDEPDGALIGAAAPAGDTPGNS